MSTGSGARDLQFGRNMFAGAFALSVVGLTQLLGRESLDRSLIAAVYCFAVSMPLSVMGVYLTTFAGHSYVTDMPRYSLVIFAVCNFLGLPAAVAGLLCIFLHFSLAAALVFLALGVVLLAIVLVENFRRE